MAGYRTALPQPSSTLPFLTQGGVETTLVFQENIDLPCFVAFTLLFSPNGADQLRKAYLPYVELARQRKKGIVLETPTWRANEVWGPQLGYSAEKIAEGNRRSVDLMQKSRLDYEVDETRIIVSGNVGPLSDAYHSAASVTIEDAKSCYRNRIVVLHACKVDMVSIMTTSSIAEAAATDKFAKEFYIPVVLVVSFTPHCRPIGVFLQERR